MGRIGELRTSLLLRREPLLNSESERFTGYLEAALEAPAITALLSNYVHQEDQDYKRAEMFATVDAAFAIAWREASGAYADSLDSNSAAHVRFTALLRGSAPFSRYDYRGLVLTFVKGALVDRMIYLVRRG